MAYLFKFLFFLWVFGVFPGFQWTRATTFVPVPIPQSIHTSSLILRGSPQGISKVDWAEDRVGIKNLYTFWEFKIQEVIKGDSSLESKVNSLILLRIPGGEKDGIGVSVPGTPRFASGEDIVIFLRDKLKDGSYEVQGMEMGKFALKKNPEGEEVLSGGGISILGPNQDKNWTLSKVMEEVRSQQNHSTDGTRQSVQNSRSPFTPKPVSTPALATPSTDSKVLTPDQPSQPQNSESSSSSSIPWAILLLILLAAGGWLVWKFKK